MQVASRTPERTWWWAGSGCAVLAVAVWFGVQAPPAPPPPMPEARPAPVLPFAFERNIGQSDAAVDFVSRARAYTLFITPRGVVVRLRDGGASLRLDWLGAAAAPAMHAESPVSGARHVLHGDAAAWRSHIPAYGRVRYAGVYPGIDLVHYGAESRLEYDWVVAPGADPRRIRMAVRGADTVALAADGGLRLRSGDRTVTLAAPRVYQDTAAGRRVVAGGYALDGDTVGFRLGGYDERLPLVIDPVLEYSGYLGGGGAERAGRMAVDAAGNVYLTGETASADFPASAGAAQTARGGGSDAYVAKFTAAGALVYVSYLGGAGSERGTAVAVDAAGAAYVTGTTDSGDFPVVGAGQSLYGGDTDAFVARLAADGASLDFAAYHGGGARESANTIAVDDDGATLYIGGGTLSTDLPVTAGVFQPSFASVVDERGVVEADAYVAKFAAADGALIYSTYLGGRAGESVFDLALAPGGELVVAGGTKSVDFPVTSPSVQPLFGGPPEDGFVSRLSPDGGTLRYSSYFGGEGWDSAQALAVGGTGTLYLAGVSASANLPVTAAAAQPDYGGGRSDGFVAAIDAAGDTVLYGSYLGGGGVDQVNDLAVAADGIVLVGETASADFPLKHALQSFLLGGQDAFVTRLDATGALAWSSYWGGGGDDSAATVALGGAGLLHVAGTSASTDLPMLNGAQAQAGGGTDAFLLGLDDADARTADIALTVSDRADPVPVNGDVEYDIGVRNLGPGTAAGVSLRSVVPDAFTLVAAVPTQGDCAGDVAALICELGDIAADAEARVAVTLRARQGGAQSFTVSVQRTRQSDDDLSNNTASAETTISVGHGAGAVGPLSLLAMVLLQRLHRRRRHA